MPQRPPGSSAATTRVGRRIRRIRWLLGALAVLGATLTALAILFWYWSGRDGSLAHAIEAVERAVPGTFHLEGASGSLRHGGHVATLSWRDQHYEVVAHDVRWSLAPRHWIALWRRGVAPPASLSVQRVELRPLAPEAAPPSSPLPIPPRLRWPWLTQLRLELTVAEWQWAAQPPWPVQARATYGYDLLDRGGQEGRTPRHTLELHQARWADGHWRGTLALQQGNTRALQGELRGELHTAALAGREPERLTVWARLRGELPPPLADPASDSPALRAVLPDWQLQAQVQRLGGPGLQGPSC